MADDSGGFELVASFFTLTGAGFGEEPRYSFVERCRAAAAAGFTGIGLHADDLPRTVASGLDVAGMQAVLADTGLRVVEIEFLGGWALATDPAELDRTVRRIEAVADAFGGRHVSAGEFRGGVPVDLGAAGSGSEELARRLAGARPAGRCGGVPLVRAGRTGRRPRAAASGPGAPISGRWSTCGTSSTTEATADALTGPIAAVQLNDGPRVHERLPACTPEPRGGSPGEGELDVVGLLRAVLRNGFTGPWCVEVNTPDFRALPVGEAARRAAAAAAAALDAAGAPRTRA